MFKEVQFIRKRGNCFNGGATGAFRYVYYNITEYASSKPLPNFEATDLLRFSSKEICL